MKKKRRNDGWVTPMCTLTGASYKYIKDNALEPQPYYNDWIESRDGMRDWYSDESKLKKIKCFGRGRYSDDCDQRHKTNIKLKKLIRRRKDRQKGRYFNYKV